MKRNTILEEKFRGQRQSNLGRGGEKRRVPASLSPAWSRDCEGLSCAFRESGHGRAAGKAG